MGNVPASHFEYWWQALPALPASPADRAYQRLSRIFLDQTRPISRGFPEGRRGQKFTYSKCETHLTVALWENFVLFDVARWLPKVWETAEVKTPVEDVQACNWSYQWAEHSGTGAKHCDIVLEYQDRLGRGVLVVEAKRPKALLGPKDLLAEYYLDLFKDESERRSLIYLVDQRARLKAETIMKDTPGNVGFLSWEQLAKVQLDCVSSIVASREVKAFIAGSLYSTFAMRGITPPGVPLDYLQEELSAEEVGSNRAKRRLGPDDYCRPLWRI